jgi:hypothetical protein
MPPRYGLASQFLTKVVVNDIATAKEKIACLKIELIMFSVIGGYLVKLQMPDF